MEPRENKTDQYFRERTELFEQQPREAVWKNISAKLGHKRKKGLAVILLRIASGAALLVSLGVGFFQIFLHNEDSVIPVVANNKETQGLTDTSKEKRINPRIVTNEADRAKTKTFHRQSGPDRIEIIGRQNNEFLAAYPSTSKALNYESSAGNTESHLHDESKALKTMISSRIAQLKGNTPGSLIYKRSGEKPLLTAEEVLNLIAQSEEEPFENPDQRIWSLGSEIAPLYSYRKITSDYLDDEVIKSLNSAEEGLLAYSGGIHIAYAAGKRLSVQSGVFYSRYGQEKTDITSYSAKSEYFYADGNSNSTGIYITNSTGIITREGSSGTGENYFVNNSNNVTVDYPVATPALSGLTYLNTSQSEETDMTAIQILDYLEVPLTLKYKFIDRKIDCNLTGGLVTNFLVKNEVSLHQNGTSNYLGKTSDIRSINYSGSIGLGIDYPVAKGFLFTVEPRFRYYLNPIDISSQLKVHPYSFGFFAGISYLF